MIMSNVVLDYRVSEFDTQQQADDYDVWFRQKVEEGLKCKTFHTHDEVMERLRQRRENTYTQIERLL
ncbi:hypothetical protein BG910_04885 [Neisseria chenwenguii]|uniref:Uncharacterized protein n=3 Tax=Neisseria chenwenguii TaxID=1853278 RepID=A0A220S104_9NEIS|nr:hypothetical protein BG910_04885 [Neisseria chenwenguii]ROV56579.1 hypothetical protein EGS38_04165 [Neisseria chenwenguii]